MMDWAEVRSRTLKRLDALQEAANAAREVELASCESIQSLWRGERVRTRHSAMRSASCEISRVFRGFRGRLRAAKGRAERRSNEDKALQEYYACCGQRTFRGYYCRKYRHDFAARKAYIQSILVKNDIQRREAQKSYESQVEANAARARDERAAEFKKLSNLHYLISTQSTPGIFSKNAEKHLARGVRDVIRLKLLPRLSIQASSPYDAPEQARRLQSKLDRFTPDFRTGKIPEPPYQKGLQGPYLERNPLLRRDTPCRYFYTTVGGNKSVVYPNGLFDVILRERYAAEGR